jgi:hypothetical protein
MLLVMGRCPISSNAVSQDWSFATTESSPSPGSARSGPALLHSQQRTSHALGSRRHVGESNAWLKDLQFERLYNILTVMGAPIDLHHEHDRVG